MEHTVRLCIVGAGRVAKVHAKSITRYSPQAKCVAIVDIDPEVAKQTANTFGISATYTSLEYALQSESFDAVVITTPTYTHKDLAILSAEAGKHILLEKPMALDVTECKAILKVVEEQGVILQMAYMRRFDPDYVLAAEKIAAGEIGQPMIIRALTNGPGIPPAWAVDLNTSGGNLAEVNSHDLDAMRWLMGSNPERIYVQVAKFKGKARGINVANYYDNFVASFRYENGGLGSLTGTCPCEYGYDNRLEVIGEKGILVVGDMQQHAVIVCTNREQGLVTPVYHSWSMRHEWGYIREMQAFVECIGKGELPRVTGVDGYWAVATHLAGTKSLLEDRTVPISEVLY
jgi:predicted dehydrogenase